MTHVFYLEAKSERHADGAAERKALAPVIILESLRFTASYKRRVSTYLIHRKHLK